MKKGDCVFILKPFIVEDVIKLDGKPIYLINTRRSFVEGEIVAAPQPKDFRRRKHGKR